jgi:uncharacterized membrane protein
MYTLAAVLGVIGAAGAIEDAAGKGMWLALLGGLGAGVLAAATGLLDWLEITPGTPLRRTATLHMAVMLSATALFAVAAVLQYDGFHDGRVDGVALVFALLGFAALMAGGWIGGSLVFVHGMRVVGEEQAPTRRAVTPTGEER